MKKLGSHSPVHSNTCVTLASVHIRLKEVSTKHQFLLRKIEDQGCSGLTGAHVRIM